MCWTWKGLCWTRHSSNSLRQLPKRKVCGLQKTEHTLLMKDYSSFLFQKMLRALCTYNQHHENWCSKGMCYTQKCRNPELQIFDLWLCIQSSNRGGRGNDRRQMVLSSAFVSFSPPYIGSQIAWGLLVLSWTWLCVGYVLQEADDKTVRSTSSILGIMPVKKEREKE